MKAFLLFSFSVFSFAIFAQLDDASYQKYEQEKNEIYNSLNISDIVPKQAFDNAYSAYFQLKKDGRINSLPIITFVNYSLPSNLDRLITVDIKSRAILLKTLVAHGKNSGSIASPATSFSNTDGSLKSSLGYFITGEVYDGKHGTSLRLDGISAGANSNARDRDIVIHSAPYVADGGRSYGCLAMKPDIYLKAINITKNKTLIYSFTANDLLTYGEIYDAIPASQDKNFSNVDHSFPQPELSDPNTSKIINGQKESIQTKINSGNGSVQILSGTSTYEKCQKLSSMSWEETVKAVNNSSNDPSKIFSGSWSDLYREIKSSEKENDEATSLASSNLNSINNCIALAHISTNTDFNMPNINSAQTKQSNDGKIKCSYGGSENQDWQNCIKSISLYNNLQETENIFNEQQKTTFSDEFTKKANSLNSNNIQNESILIGSSMSKAIGNIAKDRSNIIQIKISELLNSLNAIPTKNTLYSDCSTKFAKHGVTGLDDYNEFVKLFTNKSTSPKLANDHCKTIISKNINLTNNEAARDQIKTILKSFNVDNEALKEKESTAYTNSKNYQNIQDNWISNDSAPKDNIGPNETSGYSGDINSNSIANNKQSSFSFSELNEPHNSNNELILNNIEIINENKNIKAKSSNDNELNGNLTNTITPGLNHEPIIISDSIKSQTRDIYNDEFYAPIKVALENPKILNSLKLSTDQFNEYNRLLLLQKNSKNTNRITGGDYLNLHSSDRNIFEIISNRYMDKFSQVKIEK